MNLYTHTQIISSSSTSSGEGHSDIVELIGLLGHAICENSLVPAKHLVDDNSVGVAGKRRLREIRLILSQDMSLVHLVINVCVRIDASREAICTVRERIPWIFVIM